jgi:hypothetical protein
MNNKYSIGPLLFSPSQSIEHGYNITSSGLFIHSKGYYTKAGILNAYSASISSPNVMTMSADYGNITASFASGYVYIYNEPFDSFYNRVIVPISRSYWDTNNTIVEILGNGIETDKAFTINLSTYPFPYEGDEIIPSLYSTVEGDNSLAIGIASHAEGGLAQAVGNISHAEGYNTVAIGIASHAEGHDSKAIGNWSHAEGYGTIAEGDFQHVQGQFNKSSSIQSAFIIGDGTNENNRKNLIFAANNEVQITGSLYINPSSIALAAGTNHVLAYNNTTGEVTYTSSAGGGGGTPAPSDTFIQYNSGSTFGATSSFRFIYTRQSLQQGLSVQAIGQYSHAEGGGTTASGTGSHAEGGSAAIGDYSHAEGYLAQSIGIFSHAEGASTIALGSYSHAEGFQTKTGIQNAYEASVVDGIVTLDVSYGDITGDFGNNGGRLYLYDAEFDDNYGRSIFIIDTVTFNDPNTVVTLVDTSVNTTTAYVGNLNIQLDTWNGGRTIPGDYSHTEGDNTQAIGKWSHAENSYTLAIGDYSHAEGESTQAIGYASHAEGSNTQAVGDYSHAEGEGSEAIGQGSHAEGQDTIASGSYSHAEGYNTQAIGEVSHAEGYDAHAIGYASHAEGYNTQAIGEVSHAEGNSTIAVGDYQHVQGKFNQTSSVQSAFIIGNGTGNSSRSNLVFAAGNTVEITGSLQVTGSAYLKGLSDTSQTNVLTYNSTSGQVFFTASSAVGGGSSLKTKANAVANTSFGGSPLTASITFSTAFSNTNYAVVITGVDARSWTVENKQTTGFRINSNSTTALSGDTYWVVTAYGEN